MFIVVKKLDRTKVLVNTEGVASITENLSKSCRTIYLTNAVDMTSSMSSIWDDLDSLVKAVRK